MRRKQWVVLAGVLMLFPIIGCLFSQEHFSLIHSRNSSLENLKRLKDAHNFEEVFDNYQLGAIGYDSND